MNLYIQNQNFFINDKKSFGPIGSLIHPSLFKSLKKTGMTFYL